jgi:tyrosinase
VISVRRALAQTSYLPVGANPGFNQALDQGLHGNVHVFVGNAQGMGQIPWAANDPVFWMHHCNIDRLWVRWNASPHANPGTAAWLNKTFVFANTAGGAVRAPVKDYTNTVKCNYRYDQIETVTSPALVVSLDAIPAVTSAAPTPVAAPAVAGAVSIGSEPVRVSLRGVAAVGPQGAGSLLASRLDVLPEQRRIYLIISNLMACAPPEALCRVYLDLPEGRPADPLNRHYVGTFNFFDAVPHGEDHSTHASKPYTFDITEVAANLREQNLLQAQHTVTIVPFGQPAADAQTMVGDITIVEQ